MSPSLVVGVVVSLSGEGVICDEAAGVGMGLFDPLLEANAFNPPRRRARYALNTARHTSHRQPPAV